MYTIKNTKIYMYSRSQNNTVLLRHGVRWNSFTADLRSDAPPESLPGGPYPASTQASCISPPVQLTTSFPFLSIWHTLTLSLA